MKVDAKELRAALDKVSFPVDGLNGCVNLSASDTEERLCVETSNGISWARDSIAIAADGPKEAVSVGVNHRILSTIASVIDGTAVLKLSRDGILLITAAGKSYRIPTVPVLVEKPRFQSPDGLRIVSEIARAMRWCAKGASKDSTRPEIGGVHIRVDGSVGYVEATNGAMLLRHAISIENADFGCGEAIIPAKFSTAVSLGDGTVLVEADGHRATFTGDGHLAYGTGLVPGAYPNADAVIPKRTAHTLEVDADAVIPKRTAHTLEVDADALGDALEAVSCMCGRGLEGIRIVRINVHPNGGLSVSAGMDEEREFARALVDARSDGMEITISLNAAYLRTALETMGGKVTVVYDDGQSPVTLRCGDALAVIMPIREN